MRKKIDFFKFIKMWGIIFLAGLGISIVSIDVISSYRDFNFRADKIRADYIDRQKQLIKQEVGRAVHMIHHEKAQSEDLTRTKIKSRVYEAYSIAQNIYQQNQKAENKAKIQQMILDALRPIRFENESGYYFATRLDGVEMLFADRPQMEGSNLLNMLDTRGQFVIKDMIEIANQSGEGFYEYHWTKPELAGNDFKKISFIKLFEPYDWFIGTGLYVDDVESQIKANLLSTISRIRFGEEGYIFVNNFNGDALISNGKLFSGTKKLWEVFNDSPEKIKNIFEKEYHAALKPEGDYIYYSWTKLTTSDKESPKTSFIFGIPDLQWLVGAGVYLDDVETNIALMQTELNNQIKEKMLYYLLIIMAIVAFFSLFYNWLNQGFRKDYNLFISFFNKVVHSNEEIDREKIKFAEFDRIAEYANKMLTDRKRSEAEIRESETRFRAIFERSTVGKSLTTPDGKLLRINKAFADMLGYEIEEVQQLDFTQITYPDDIKESRECIRILLAGEQTDYRMEKRYVGKNGNIIWANVSTTLLRNEQGTPLYFITGIMDITEQKRADAEKLKLQEQLLQAQKMEAIGTLAGGIAHDFNNILSAVIGYTELAQMKLEADSEIKDDLKGVLIAGVRAKDLVNQILAFSRQTQKEQMPVKMGLIVKEVLKLLRSSLPVTIDMRQNINSQSVVLSDPTQLHQIVMNLCTNAAHAMREKGGILEVVLTDVALDSDFCSFHPDIQPGAYQKLTISDTGHGMTTDVTKKIFDPFFTTKSKGEGTGLGLSVVHGIVKDLGGTITVYSEPDKGTTFNLYFPIIKSRSEEKPEEQTIIPGGIERILVVDDEKAITDIINKSLSTLGYGVEVKTCSLDALALFKAMPDKFDIVITDMTMPQMTGDMLARELMKIRPDLPVILCTGFSENITKEKAETIGIKAFLMKPLLKEEMAHTIRKVLDEANDAKMAEKSILLLT